MRLITCLGILALVAVTPLRATEGFYIVKEEGSDVCKVVDTKPTDGKAVLVDEVIYSTELEAKDAITKIDACPNK